MEDWQHRGQPGLPHKKIRARAFSGSSSSVRRLQIRRCEMAPGRIKASRQGLGLLREGMRGTHKRRYFSLQRAEQGGRTGRTSAAFKPLMKSLFEKQQMHSVEGIRCYGNPARSLARETARNGYGLIPVTCCRRPLFRMAQRLPRAPGLWIW